MIRAGPLQRDCQASVYQRVPHHLVNCGPRIGQSVSLMPGLDLLTHPRVLAVICSSIWHRYQASCSSCCYKEEGRDDEAMQGTPQQREADLARLLAAAEQRVWKAEQAVAKQCALLDELKHGHLSPELIDQAERLLAALQDNLQVHRNGLQRRRRIEDALPTSNLSE
jgi:hypothetical protein